MKALGRVLGLTMLLVCFLWAITYPSTNEVQTYVSKNGLISSPKFEHSELLFAQQMEDSIKVRRTDSIHSERARTAKLKEPYKAFLYAVVPGVVVHGTGHFYAGKTTTGFLLLGSELVGATLILGGTSTGWGRSSPTREGFTVALIGGTLFFGSWIYDMVKSPLIVQKQNQKLLQGNHADLKFRIKDGDLRLVTVWRF